jgi:hypothetical protein
MADFKLGRIKFKWRGNWATSTAYLVDDIVKYGGNTYVAVTNHTSQSTSPAFYTDLDSNSYWQLHTEGLFFKGDWAQSTHYKLNDLVKYGSFQYRTTTQHTSSSTFDPSKFEVYGEGFQFEDTYNASTVYQDGDVVTYGGYSYVYINTTPAAGQTPTDNSYWDVLTTGFKTTGDYSHGTTYKTGDVAKYGGNSYVCIANHTNQYPANTDGTTNTTYWNVITTGFYYRSTYSAATSYNIGDVVRYVSSTYVQLKDRQINVTPGTDGTVWALIAQGDTGAVLTTEGDIIYQDNTQATRLPIGVVGSVLTTNGTQPSWSAPEGANVKYVANSGSNSNSGTQFLPYKTLYYALSQATSGDITDFNTITGGTGGTPGTYIVSQLSTTGSGIGSQIQVITDGSSTPTVAIVSGGSGHAAGDVITFNGADVGGASNVTITVVSASVGDVIYVKNGVYRETLPLRIPSGVTVQGESLRGTEIRPASGTGHQVKTVSVSGGTGGTPGTYNYVHQTTSGGAGDGLIINVTTDGSSTPSVTIYHGGYGHVLSDVITFDGSNFGGSTDIQLTVTALEDNNASNMFLLNNVTNLVQMTMKGLTGTPGAGATGKAAVTSLDPTGSITTASPYVQNCSSNNSNATGIQIDGNLHSAGNKSILANDYTQINSDGIGVHALARGRGEMVSVFTYYCAKSFFAESGGFIRGLNCSSAYGEIGAEADGTDPTETTVNVQSNGEMLKYDTTTFVGAATESDIQDMISTQGQGSATILGVTSGATATIFRTNISLDYLHIESRSGNFTQGETVTITKENSTTFQVQLDSSFGDSSAAETGQQGPLISVKSGTTSLNASGIITIGTNIKFTGDSKYYRISAISEEDTIGGTATVRLTESITNANQKSNSTVADVTQNFSNVRLTGHDFLDIGTGDVITSNYPGGPSQPADQADEVNELNGGRVYFSSTDQKGDFRIGDQFRIEQATGIATLNADAFDLSGLNELQLGSIGAELGATINEFSTDETLGGDANTAVPTERAVKGYLTRDKAGTGAWVPPTGTTAERPTGGNLYTGAIRYNSSLVTWEGYNGSQWTGLGGGNPWQTHTADGSTALTVAANDRYFIDTTAGAQTVNLPASPLVGDQVHLLDLAGTFDTNNLTIGRNSLKIMGQTADMTVAVEDAALQLVYTGATYGWKLVQNN